MANHVGHAVSPGSWTRDTLFLGNTFGAYVRSLVTPFNIVAAIILCIGASVTFTRFTQGLAATTNLTNNSPWGIWIAFDVLCGVALAAGGFVMASTVHLFGLRDYRPLVRPAILTGFLGYAFVVVGLLFDLGRPWRLPNPMFRSFGLTSVMFEVAWCVSLYLTVQFIEFCPAVFEWLRWPKLRRISVWVMTGATVMGVVLSTLHQSALGGLFLIAEGKVHPLWYSPYIPLLFFASAVVAGISMVIVESMISHRVFKSQVEDHDHAQMDRLVIGLGKAGSIVLLTYFALKMVALVHGHHWDLILTPLGGWWLVEVLGFVLLPCLLFAFGVRARNAALVRFTAVIAVLGVVLNRLNVALVAYHWDAIDRYVPSWQEITITLSIVTALLLTFRWIANRMPVLRDHPEFGPEH